MAMPPGAPAYRDGQLWHQPPTVAELEADPGIHPELKKSILYGRDLFIDTQKLRGRFVFNDLSCGNCHPVEGRKVWSGPIWPAATTFPNYRAKNRHVNTLEERIAGCFSYSMNGRPPPGDSEEMVALMAYTRWLATGAPVYEDNIYGRGFRHLGTTMPADTDRRRGEAIYETHCAACHGSDGAGLRQGKRWISPPLWGDGAYNWGSGMSRIFTAAAFIHLNMPFGRGGLLTEQESWDVALYINSHERPQDPRFAVSAQSTRERYEDFHRHTLYGLEIDGRVLGQHDNTGEKPFLTPEILRLRPVTEASKERAPVPKR
jgi:thiosulfate dehydrogenase